MADEGQVIRGINWREALPFTHIFRSFRIAIHLSKLALGLALLLSVYLGGYILDNWVWPRQYLAVPGEVTQYQMIVANNDQTSLSDWRQEQRKSLDGFYVSELTQVYGIVTPLPNESPEDFSNRTLKMAEKQEKLDALETKIVEARQQDLKNIQKSYDQKMITAQQRDAQIRAAYDARGAEWQQVQNAGGEGLFESFFQYEIRQVNNVVEGVLGNNWLAPGGVKDCIYNFFAVGPVWLVLNHVVFFIFFAILFLVVWALFGGAISRIAAVHIARDEKISLRQAMNFAVGKLLSFASAPVIPLLIVIVIGLIVALVSLLGVIPFLGPIVVGVFFIFALLAGFVMTLVLLGTAGGFNLMYPTIAVEGSDSFDAISRSFSYIYARPWRMLFYTTVAVAYGAATYLFVHMFIWLALGLTHYFVGVGMFTHAGNTSELLTALWPGPTRTGRLSYSADYFALTAGQKIGAFFINCWVMFMVCFLGAFAISLYFSANTIIYYLMRGEVDATEMEDVYLEQSEEELEPALTTATATVTVTTETPAAEAPSAPAPPAAEGGAGPQPPAPTPPSP